MTSLKPYVTLEFNSDTCTILKVKPNSKLGLISLGFFDGDEEYFRITKDIDQNESTITCTVFYHDRTPHSWRWGSSTTCVDLLTKLEGYLIHQCIEEDFLISCTKRPYLKKYVDYKRLGK